MIGRILDNRYEITEKIGSGGMADVYCAHDILLDRIVAVKILHEDYANDQDFVTRFRKEAQAAAKLSHANIVNIYDVGCDDNVHYIVMEYVAGETLKEYIARQKKLSNDAAVRIAMEIGEALEQAHANGIVHCDIKPHNILVTRTGKIKVADFGIARAMNTATVMNKESVLGSVHYFSPEQAAGEKVTAQTDIYSLGVVLYEMLTGRVPYEGDTAVAIALKHMQEEVPKPSRYNPTITPLLEDCVLKALQKDPEKRFNNISEMIADLRLAQGLVTHVAAKTGRHNFATGAIPIPHQALERKRQSDEKENWLTGLLGWPMKRILIAIAALFFFAAGLAFWFVGDFWRMQSVTVPNLIGKQVEVARKTLEKEDLNVSVNEIASEEVPIGQVINQSPEPGTSVKTHRTIHLTVSKGGSIILVPDLTGLTIEEAGAKLRSIHLRLGKIEEREDVSKPLDTIIGQSPSTPTKVERDSTVHVILNKKNMVSRVNIPDFSGLTVEKAEQLAQENDLTKGRWKMKTGGEPSKDSVVTTQNPAAGSSSVRGTAIDLTFDTMVKKAEITIRVPSKKPAQRVTIMVHDANGTRTLFDREEKAGTEISTQASGVGSVRVEVYFDGELVQEQEL